MSTQKEYHSYDSKTQQELDIARTAILDEVAGLTSLSQKLDMAYLKAVDYLNNCKGRIIVSGIGKSGHIARKIAATFTSTGTPAYFLHPSEASHGDLGIVQEEDAILILSNSGETPELSDLITHTRRFNAPLIAITQKKESALAKAATVILEIPTVKEACPMGLAPTTSTVMMLALGDALAVSLLHRKGFGASDFKILHPGGQLGRKLLYVRELMRTGPKIPLSHTGTLMSEALIIMTQQAMGCIGIIDSAHKLQGVITDGDLRRHMGDQLLISKVEEIMTTNPKTIQPNALIAEAINIMNAARVTNLFVVENNSMKPLGILHIHDCLKMKVA